MRCYERSFEGGVRVAVADVTGDSAGDYRLHLGVGRLQFEAGPTAVSVPLSLQNNRGGAPGSIDVPDEQDLYEIRPTASGTLTVRNSAAGAGLDTALYVYDAANQLIASTGGGAGAAAQVTFDARARQSYFVRVAASPATVPGGDVGAYSLSVTPDDAGSGIGGGALPVGAGGRAGTVNADGDVDAFRFVAGATGQLQFGLSGGAGAPPGAALSVFDAGRNLLGSGGAFQVAAGQVVFFQVTGFDAGSKYNLDLGLEADGAALFPDLIPDLSPGVGGTSSSPDGAPAGSSTSGVLARDLAVAGLDTLADGASFGQQGDVLGQVTELASLPESELALVAVLLVGLTANGEADPGAVAGNVPPAVDDLLTEGLEALGVGSRSDGPGAEGGALPELGRLLAVVLSAGADGLGGGQLLGEEVLDLLAGVAGAVRATGLLPEEVVRALSVPDSPAGELAGAATAAAREAVSWLRAAWEAPSPFAPDRGIADLLIPDPRPLQGGEAPKAGEGAPPSPEEASPEGGLPGVRPEDDEPGLISLPAWLLAGAVGLSASPRRARRPRPSLR